MTNTTDAHDYHNRIRHIEKQQASMDARLEGIENTLRDVAHSVQTITTSTKTNWGTLAAWASVIVAVMVYHTGLSINPLKEELQRLDIILQREMRLLNDASIARVAGMDTVLQREIDLNVKILDEKIKAIHYGQHKEKNFTSYIEGHSH